MSVCDTQDTADNGDAQMAKDRSRKDVEFPFAVESSASGKRQSEVQHCRNGDFDVEDVDTIPTESADEVMEQCGDFPVIIKAVSMEAKVVINLRGSL